MNALYENVSLRHITTTTPSFRRTRQRANVRVLCTHAPGVLVSLLLPGPALRARVL